MRTQGRRRIVCSGNFWSEEHHSCRRQGMASGLQKGTLQGRALLHCPFPSCVTGPRLTPNMAPDSDSQDSHCPRPPRDSTNLTDASKGCECSAMNEQASLTHVPGFWVVSWYLTLPPLPLGPGQWDTESSPHPGTIPGNHASPRVCQGPGGDKGVPWLNYSFARCFSGLCGEAY